MKLFMPDFWSRESQRWGIARGYYHVFDRIRLGMSEMGHEVTHDEEEEVDKDLFVCPPTHYVNRGLPSAVYTMWEDTVLPEGCAAELRKADGVMVPSSWCRDIFAGAGVESRVIPLGIDQLPFKKRSPKKPFRWLFLGSTNFRKGADIIDVVWRGLLDNDNMELYIKTTAPDGVKRGIFQTDSNVTVDTRRVDQQTLVDIYHSADAFLFPTAGEGFGLTLAEAMSTGLPCICTEYSGHLDFTDEKSVFYIGLHEGGSRLSADPVQLAKAMKQVVGNYRKALIKGKRASRAVSRLTWDNSCRGIYTFLNTC